MCLMKRMLLGWRYGLAAVGLAVIALLIMDFNNRMTEYLTNGKDVLHIHPASLELVKLLPDPRVEKILGKFPEAFRLPTPQQPPHPFSNHEAPAAFKKDWAPPAGWRPPEDYPRSMPSGAPRRRRT